MMAGLKATGLSIAVKDSLIAATARAHGLTVAIRNIADFRHAGVPILNPFEEPSES
jgi:predicted nucleic acid-binding protein